MNRGVGASTPVGGEQDTQRRRGRPTSQGGAEGRNRTPLWAFLAANVVSISGTRVSAIAIPWLVLTTTGSATKTGLVVVFEMTPLVITKALGGPIIDRIGPRRVSVVADLASAVLVGLVPLLHVLGLLSFPALLGLVALAGAARGPSDAAKGTLVPDIAEQARVPIERVTGLESSTDRTATIIGPAVAGVIIALVGAANALVIDAASFAVCAMLIGLWGPARHLDETDDDAPPETYRRQLRSGWDFLVHEPLMRSITAMIFATNLLDMAFMSVLLPVWIMDHGYGTTQIGLIGSVFGVTATIGALLAAALGERLPRRITYLVAFAIAGCPRFIALALGAPIWLILGICAVGGFGAGFINPIIGAIYISRIPRPLLGRVGSLAESMAWAGMPLGGIAAGGAVAVVGLAPALLLAGGIYFLATTLPGLLPQWKEMDERRTPTPPPAGHGFPEPAGVPDPESALGVGVRSDGIA